MSEATVRRREQGAAAATYCRVPGDMRSIAPIMLTAWSGGASRPVLGRARSGSPTVSPVCDCGMSESIQRRCGPHGRSPQRIAAANGAVEKLASQGRSPTSQSCAGGTGPLLVRVSGDWRRRCEAGEIRNQGWRSQREPPYQSQARSDSDERIHADIAR